MKYIRVGNLLLDSYQFSIGDCSNEKEQKVRNKEVKNNLAEVIQDEEDFHIDSHKRTIHRKGK